MTIDTRTEPAEVVCEAMASACECVLDAQADHEVHECDCGGQWKGTNPDYTPVRYPGGFGR